MKQLTDIELKKASIFDLTDDIKLIRMILDMGDVTQEEASHWNSNAKITSLLQYADFVKDSTFRKRILNVFKDEWEECIIYD